MVVLGDPKVEEGRRLISHSELATFKECKRKWFWDCYSNLELANEKEDGHLALGTRVHIGLAEYYNPENLYNRESALKKYWQSVEDAYFRGDYDADDNAADRFNSEAELGDIMLKGYFDWVEETGADTDWEILAAEDIISVPFQGFEDRTGFYKGVNLVGKLDLRIRRRHDGARMFVDNKTCANLSDIPKWAHLSEQFKHYALLEMLQVGSDDIRTDGGIYNMLRKVKRTVKAKPPFYGRWEVKHNIHELRSYWMRLAKTVEEILETEKILREGSDPRYAVPPTPTDRCSWKCDFFPVCPMMDDGSDVAGMIEDYYTVGDPLKRYRKEGEL